MCRFESFDEEPPTKSTFSVFTTGRPIRDLLLVAKREEKMHGFGSFDEEAPTKSTFSVFTAGQPLPSIFLIPKLTLLGSAPLVTLDDSPAICYIKFYFGSSSYIYMHAQTQSFKDLIETRRNIPKISR